MNALKIFNNMMNQPGPHISIEEDHFLPEDVAAVRLALSTANELREWIEKEIENLKQHKLYKTIPNTPHYYKWEGEIWALESVLDKLGAGK